ncbi:3-oxoacyl-ACP synthase III [bacterium]|nr:3-oxoacyl-ACP synthase III [bacterium]
MLHKNVYLQSLVYELPKIVVTTESIFNGLGETFSRLGIPASWVAALSGVNERRVWEADDSLIDIACRVAKSALDRSGLKPEDIGCVICTSVTKDFIEPAMACMVHEALGLSPSAVSFDISNACLAFINGMSYVGQMIDGGVIKAALLVDVENSRFVLEKTRNDMKTHDTDLADFSKRFAGLTLGSGAVAAVLTDGALNTANHRITGSVSLADTKYCRSCIGSLCEIVTDQTRLMKAGVELARRTWDVAAQTLGWTPEALKHFICHQVGASHIKLLFDTLKLDIGKAFQTFPFLGNVGPASAPITMAIAAERGIIKAGERVGIMGIGSGLNCSMMEIVW